MSDELIVVGSYEPLATKSLATAHPPVSTFALVSPPFFTRIEHGESLTGAYQVHVVCAQQCVLGSRAASFHEIKDHQ